MNDPDDVKRTTEAFQPQDSGPGPEAQPLSLTTLPGRLELLGAIARGGMGDVLRGRDADLGRDVAVKVLRQDRRDDASLLQRFAEEARIAARLQHPGVLPVYAIGRLPDGRPYFTMKLVKGRTLAELLAERREPASDLPRFLAIFEQVCQTLAYAHAHGVIHRDLKPSNVMVGAYGEVQVMDWGLAKVLPRDGTPDALPSQEATEAASVIRTPRGEGSGPAADGSETRPGTVMGTPAYMAPEQARGEVEAVDERSDVFGLGALLCELLTGRPPFVGPAEAAQKRAARADLSDAFAHLDGCGADAELIAVARRCLAAEPAERPRDAGETAAVVTAYRESVELRLRRAELARATEAARAQEARATAAQERRARRLTLALAASVLAMAAVGVAVGLGVQRQWAVQAAEAARRRQAIEAALEKASALQQQAHWAEARAVLEQTRDQLVPAAPEDLRTRVGQALADADLVSRLEAIRLRSSTWVESAFDYRGADQDYAAAFRDAGLAQDGDDAAAGAARIRASAVCDELVAALDDWATWTPDLRRQAWLLETARCADPDPWRDRFRDPALWGDRVRLEALAKELLDDEKQLAGQKAQLLAALGANLLLAHGDAAPLLAAAQAHYPDDFWLNLNLGLALIDAKKWNEAVGFFRVAIAVRPSAAAAHNNLGAALHDAGRPDQAIAEFRRAIDIDANFAPFHNNLGNALRAAGRTDDAIPEFRRATEIGPQFVDAHHNLGQALEEAGRPDEAVQEFRAVVKLTPDNAGAHNALGRALHETGRPDEAIREFSRAIELDPKDCWPHNNLGNVLRDSGQTDEAKREYRRAIDLDPQFAQAHTGLGGALYDERRLDEAAQEFRRAIDLDPKGATAHNDLGLALHDMGRPDEAIREYHRALELNPKYAHAHYNLGNALRQQAHLDEAAREYRRAIDLDPKFAQAYCNLGTVLRRAGRFAESLDAYRTGHQLGAAQPGWRYPSAQWVHEAEALVAWEEKLPAVLAGKERPTDNAERLGLAQVCALKLRYASAVRLYRDGLADDPKLADDLKAGNRYNAACCAARAGCGQGEDAKDLDDKERMGWRAQARSWLQADLLLWATKIDDGKPEDRAAAAQRLRLSQEDADLAGLRDPAELAKLPTDEQDVCKKLWADVQALLDKAQTKE